MRLFAVAAAAAAAADGLYVVCCEGDANVDVVEDVGGCISDV